MLFISSAKILCFVHTCTCPKKRRLSEHFYCSSAFSTKHFWQMTTWKAFIPPPILIFPQTPMLYWGVQYLELHEEYVPSVREVLIPQSCYIFPDNHSLSTRLIFNDTRMSMAIYNVYICPSHTFADCFLNLGTVFSIPFAFFSPSS